MLHPIAPPKRRKLSVIEESTLCCAVGHLKPKSASTSSPWTPFITCDSLSPFIFLESTVDVFDDNDNFATHALGYVGEEPVSTVRLRFFGDFVKLERACVRPKYRNRHILPKASEGVARSAGQKGYKRIVTHAAPATARLWRILGFTISDKAPAQFAGHEHEYVELVKDIALRNDAVTLAAEAAVLFRQETALDQPNSYEIAA